jgi:hypothetical protein
MATTTVKRKAYKSVPNFDKARIYVDVPKSDMTFFQLFADKMGWAVEETKEELWDRFIATYPKDVPLTDDDIMGLVREVRYGKV